jgi:hypothetical protein
LSTQIYEKSSGICSTVFGFDVAGNVSSDSTKTGFTATGNGDRETASMSIG